MFKGVRDIILLASFILFSVLLVKFELFFTTSGATAKVVLLCYLSYILILLFKDK